MTPDNFLMLGRVLGNLWQRGISIFFASERTIFIQLFLPVINLSVTERCVVPSKIPIERGISKHMT